MLRKRSRGVGSKQDLMPDYSSLPSPIAKYNRPTTSLFPSPRPFVGFTGKGFSEAESVMSPTSILEAKHFSAIGNLVSSPMEVAATNLLRTPSFREDTYFVHLLRLSERKALQDLKDILSASPPEGIAVEDLSMWGVPLLGGDGRTDVVLLKFLRAGDFSIAQAHAMLLRCAAWRPRSPPPGASFPLCPTPPYQTVAGAFLLDGWLTEKKIRSLSKAPSLF